MGEQGMPIDRAWDADRSYREKPPGLGPAINAIASDGYLVHIRRTDQAAPTGFG